MENKFYSLKEWCGNCDYGDTNYSVCINCITQIIKNSGIITEEPKYFREKDEEEE